MIEIKSEKQHVAEVETIRQQFKNGSTTVSLKRPRKLSNTLRDEGYKKQSNRIDLSHLNRVVSIDPEGLTATVEPRITMSDLCKNTLRYGLVPLVVPEFTTITVGGAIMGSGLESTSHRHGQFSDICLEYELILGDGSLIKASPEENSDLFYGLSGSYGSLAMLTQAKIRLMPAQPCVHLTYHRFSDVNSLLSFLKLPQDELFVEGVMLSKESGLAITGHLTDEKPTFRMNRSWSPWYYQRLLQTHQSDVIPIQDYLFRWDRAAFWMARYLLSFPLAVQTILHKDLPSIPKKMRQLSAALTPEKVPSWLFRLLFGWAVSSKRLYHLWHSIPNKMAEKLCFVQDFYTPVAKVEEVYELFQGKTGIFPVMFCPIKGTDTPQFLSPHFGGSDFINIGLYGIPQSPRTVPEITAELEKEILAAGGRKMLYAMTYYDEETFSKFYPKEPYLALRKKFYSDNVFLPLYNKVAPML